MIQRASAASGFCETVAVDWNMVEAVGTWFAGIATAGSLWLGFTILRSDRKKAERDQAGKVAIFSKVLFWEPAHPEHGLQIQVRVWNNSPLPIIDPALYGIQPGDFMHLEFTTLRSDQPDEVLLPGESAKIEFKNMDHIDREQLYVTFSDANGVDWKYKLTSHRLSKLKFKDVTVSEGGIVQKALRPVLD